jgi:DNA-binding NtrC family response regulator
LSGEALAARRKLGKPLQLSVGLAASHSGARNVAKILVVEDDRVMQLTMSRVLAQAGHVEATAGNRQKALVRLESGAFIMISGRSHTLNSTSEPDYLTMATRLGAVSALPKPFKPGTLLTMASDCLASAGKQAAPPRSGHDVVSNS